ncbi:hypothetical protein MY3296_004162 [Beauveria thailandica]
MVYSLHTVLAVAKKHSFYDQSVTYPPDIDAIQTIVEQSKAHEQSEGLASWPLLHKKTLYSTIQRLINDTSPQNTFRQAIYASITGGGRGAQPLFFATDVEENRLQRAEYGKLLAKTGVLKRGDWVVTVHSAGGLYRALDLVMEVSECAGACALGAGNYMPPAQVWQLVMQYQANVLAGDSSQIVNLVNHLSALSAQDRARIRLDKIIYTSEVLTGAQRAHIRATLGGGVVICSMLASAEAGPWAVSNSALTGHRTTTSSDFIYDARTMAVEIFPNSVVEKEDSSSSSAAQPPPPPPPSPLPDGETGAIVLTSLCRLRNPLVRYMSGDVGSLHPLPEAMRHLVDEAERPHLRVLRLEGRDRRFSFDWEGEYVEFTSLAAIVEDERYGILQWQAIIENKAHDKEALRPILELRMLPSTASRGNKALLTELVDRVKVLIEMAPYNEDRFVPVFLDNLDGFERSNTGRKVIKFIDRVS